MSAAGYDIDQWANFFVATLGAAAALTGLLFVAISINLNRILSFPRLPGRAASTLGILVAVILTGCFGLAPDQSTLAIGIEFGALGFAVAAQSFWVLGRRQVGAADTRSHTVEQLMVVLLPAVTLFIGGLSLALGVGGGLFWTLAGVVLSFAVAVINAWVLLVEINR